MADVPKLGGNTNKTPQAVRRELRMEAGGQVSTDRPGVRESPSKNDIMDEATKIEIKVQELQLEVLEKLNTVTHTVLSSIEGPTLNWDPTNSLRLYSWIRRGNGLPIIPRLWTCSKVYTFMLFINRLQLINARWR